MLLFSLCGYGGSINFPKQTQMSEKFYKKKSFRVFAVVLFTILFFLLGQKRQSEFIKISYPQYPTPEIIAHAAVSPSHPYFMETILCPICNEKWLMTFLFSMLFLGLSVICSWVVFQNFQSVKYTIYLYGMLFLSTVFILAAGYFTGHFSESYRVVNKIIWIIQSPVVVMLIFPIMKLQQQKTH